MLEINSMEELQKYYDVKTNTFAFKVDNIYLDVKFNINLCADSNIVAGDIKARNIEVRNIEARNIKARDIKARNINIHKIDSEDIIFVYALRRAIYNLFNIGNPIPRYQAGYIDARNINAREINALDIKAGNIIANDIRANSINYYALCIAYKNLSCKNIIGRRKNSIHKCLNDEM